MEIMMQVARHFPKLPNLWNKLRADSVAPTLTAKAITVYNKDPKTLKLQFAAMLDMRTIVRDGG